MALSDFGDYLRARRAHLTPADVGLPVTPRRKVAGMRREEVAMLAGLSVDYYVRLEQGRVERVTPATVHALSKAMLLDERQREHLTALASPDLSPFKTPSTLTPEIGELLSKMQSVPAIVVGRYQQVRAANRLGHLMVPDYLRDGGNGAEHVFLDPTARRFYDDWRSTAEDVVANLRFESGRYPSDGALRGLLQKLRNTSPEFSALWEHGAVRARTNGPRVFNHPTIGQLRLHYEALTVASAPELSLLVYLPVDSTTSTRLTALCAQGR